uniref:Uncharacterized protein n=1 Tax=Utricularia reniformis TaxID=192314 RepID=A0A1Y0B3E7_9LAMI|nr:hypothetical protein AEK19_MT1804 [Utricularia reniformis]ART31975.1 hypothetical protein AEK19_MT1804 [Utricularia reniformis]
MEEPETLAVTVDSSTIAPSVTSVIGQAYEDIERRREFIPMDSNSSSFFRCSSIPRSFLISDPCFQFPDQILFTCQLVYSRIYPIGIFL